MEDSDAEIDEVPTANDRATFRAMMQRALEIFDEQEACGNMKFVEKFMSSNASNGTLVEEIQRLKNQHTMPHTWAPNRHPATMYYQ